ncbi:rna polymerase ii-associated protein 3 isoform 2 [Stylonychia lemnae]|uniref:RNA polymerase II-associated protein 3 n=1 Tax=Stylonychia lemnae TaxID=5949 RepID=A0A078AVB9_STYLE|nr:rna polymerase ii-associated protein 3 isoform 2 [Stylonychia lemnae]|eukprot:CDW85227.1 rna polymerase ii-associated protein 3 isoform 2 [Stylonychia lemnae]
MADPRFKNEEGGNSRPKYNLDKIDFDWVEKSTDVKELLKAHDALKDDAGFPDLLRAVSKRIILLDPKQRGRVGNSRVSVEDEQIAAKDIADFLNDIQKLDSKLSAGSQQNDDGAIFSRSGQQDLNRKFAEEIERKKQAEHERLKGNEFMKSKEYKEALDCYTKSIDMFPDDAATYSNRAQVHLMLKEYSKVIEDANKALQIQPDYLKALHRRGKAFQAVNKTELAIKDFQRILEIEPNNKEAMKNLKEARASKDHKKSSTAPKEKTVLEEIKEEVVEEKQVEQPKKEDKFVRVAIQEESDDEEQEEVKVESTSKVQANAESDKENQSKKSNIEVVNSQENDTWWKENNQKQQEQIKEQTKEVSAQKQPEEIPQVKIEEVQASQFKRIPIQEDDDDADDEEEVRLVNPYVEQNKPIIEEKKEEPKKVEQKSVEEQKKEAPKEDPEVKAKADEKIRLEKLIKEIDQIKEEASAEYKRGMYDDAVKVFEKAADLAEKNLSQYKYYKKDIIEREATIFNNIAACYKQGQHNKKEVEYCSKVIERAPYINDITILAKAYLRRGFAYEHLEKIADAKEDMIRVKEIQPNNQQASQALTRLNRALQDANKVDISDYELKIAKTKDAGNALFQQKKFNEAIAKFSEGVDIFLKNPDQLKKDKDIKLKVTQIYTNRSLSHHQLGNHQKAFEDADYVLKNLDQVNPKALFRRAIANKSFEKYEDSVKDLQNLFKQDQTKADIKTELDQCMRLLVEQNKAKKEQQQQQVPTIKETIKESVSNGQKIQEISSSINDLQEQIKKAEEESKNQEKIAKQLEEEVKKTSSALPKKTKNLNQEVIDKAADIATQQTNKNLIKAVPKTAAGFETDYNSLKKEPQTFYQYVKNIPFTTIENFFKNCEISAELFAAIVRVLSEYGLSEDIKHSAQLIKSLAKASSFDMTLMFMDSKEKNDLKQIINAIKNSSEIENDLVKEIVKIYNF